MITAISKRKNVIDSNFILIEDADKRYRDTRDIYMTVFLTKAVELLERYDVDYILLTPQIKKELGITEISYIDQNSCFELVYNKTTKIYHTRCSLT